MPSFRSTVLAVATVLITCANADYYVEPDSVPLSTRQAWCNSEKDTCPFICQQMGPGTTLVNECDPEKLTYGCLCGDNKQPNVTEYTLTLPYFVCQEWGNQCVKKCQRNNLCAAACREDHPCGATNPVKPNKTTASGALQPTASDNTIIYTGTPGDDKKGAAAVTVPAGATMGIAVLVSGVVAGIFAL